MYTYLRRLHEHFYLFGHHVNEFGGPLHGVPNTAPRCIELFFVRKAAIDRLKDNNQ